ncbi:uncharacterized protein LOC124647794 [Lolium rigidum]|uniref:uncharacterized protein LOC124647794 n=1 Tax=Lolium rigidum TaxID=89674 RepID=UPI001F5C87D8|nr:uncharacterized protein LOC124647794 [Lolium rigidum]
MAAAAVGGAVVPPMPPQQDEKAAQQPLMAVVAPLLPQPEGAQPPGLGPDPVEEGYKETPQDENPLQVQGSADEGGKETPQDENPLHVPGPADEGDKGASSQDKNLLQAPGPADEGDNVTMQDENPWDDIHDHRDRSPCRYPRNFYDLINGGRFWSGPRDPRYYDGQNLDVEECYGVRRGRQRHRRDCVNPFYGGRCHGDHIDCVHAHHGGRIRGDRRDNVDAFHGGRSGEEEEDQGDYDDTFHGRRYYNGHRDHREDGYLLNRGEQRDHRDYGHAFRGPRYPMNGLYHDNPLGYPYGHHDRFSFGGPRFLSHYNPMDSLDDKRVYARTPCCFRNRIREKKDYPVGASLLNPEKWTCFLNCILQCVVHTVPLVSKLLKDRHLGLCPSGLDEFCCYCSLRHHASEAIRLSGNILYPKKFVKLLKLICQDFSWGRHQDAHELLRCLLDKLDDASVAPMGVSSEEPSSIVKQVFGGQVKSQLHCPECNHCSDRLESFLDLSLEINQMDTLLDSLESFTKTEVVESFTCDGCKTRVNMEKHLKVEQAPEVLVIQLKRFENLGSNISKIQEMVKYQLELDLKPFMSSADTNPQKYDLYGVVEHLGESSKGHYVCYIRSSETDWYLFNDEKVMQLSEDKVLDSKAYLLFYVKQGSSPWFSTLLEEKNTLLLGYLQELADKGLNEDGVSIDSDKGSYSRSGSGSDSDEQDLSDAEMLYRRSLGGGLSGETKRPTSPPRSSLENGNVRRMSLVSKNNENVSLQGSRGKEMSHSTHGLPSHVNGAGSRGGSSRENGESCSLLQSSSHKPEEDCCPENLTLHKDDEMRGSCVSPAGEVRAHYGVETRARKRMRQQSAAGTMAKRRKGGGLKKALLKKSVGGGGLKKALLKKSVGGGGLKKALLKKSNLTEHTGDSILPYGYNTMDVKLSGEIGGHQRQSEKGIGGCLPLLFREDLLLISAGAMKIRAEPSGDRRYLHLGLLLDWISHLHLGNFAAMNTERLELIRKRREEDDEEFMFIRAK